MHRRRGSAAILGLVLLLTPVMRVDAGPHCRGPRLHSAKRHNVAHAHRHLCRVRHVASVVVSESAGAGRIELAGKLAAVLLRDEGFVVLLDVSSPSRPKVLGRFEDDVQDSLDGDLAFSHDAEYLFYARQTEQFSRDGVHVLDVSDPSQPSETFYQPSGGTLRLGYYYDGSSEWVVFLDAIDGLVVCRFVRESGSLIEVFRDSTPPLKVGGPASAGIFIDRKDPKLEIPLMYITTGRTGLQIYDFSNPAAPSVIGSWPDVGLAEIELRRSKKRRVVYAASEYWFDDSLPPEIHVLDATDVDAIKRVRRLRLGLPAEEFWRVQGMALWGSQLLVAHSHAGFVVFNSRGKISAAAQLGSKHREEAAMTGAVYAMDVERRRRNVWLTDASTGRLHALRLVR
jgi:hypothetical protein